MERSGFSISSLPAIEEAQQGSAAVPRKVAALSWAPLRASLDEGQPKNPHRGDATSLHFRRGSRIHP